MTGVAGDAARARDEDAALAALVDRMGGGGVTATPYAVAYGYLRGSVALLLDGQLTPAELGRDASLVEVALLRHQARLAGDPGRDRC